MAVIKQLCISFLAVAIICFVVNILIPNGNLEKISKVAINLILLCSLFLGIKQVGNFKIPENNVCYDFNADRINRELSEKTANQIIALAEKNLEKEVYKALLNTGISAKQVNIIMDTDDSKSIFIKESNIFIDCADKKNKEEIKNIVDKYLNTRITKVKVCDTY